MTRSQAIFSIFWIAFFAALGALSGLALGENIYTVIVLGMLGFLFGVWLCARVYPDGEDEQ